MKKIFKMFITCFMLSVIVSSVVGVNAEETTFDSYKVPVDINVNGNYLDGPAKGFLGGDGVVYVPIRYNSVALGAEVTWNDESKSATVKRGEDALVFVPSLQSCYVNGNRYVASQKIINNSLYTDVNFLFANLGTDVAWDGHNHEIKVTAPGYCIPPEYIEDFYTSEDVYWLSKIVYCEAGSVSFKAKVMVANVVINRRGSGLFPNTIYGVIYDTKFGVQFPPAHNGKVANAEPTSHTVLACKAALNGLDLAPGCLYFNYASDTNGWVAKNRPLYTVVGNQAFYK